MRNNTIRAILGLTGSFLGGCAIGAIFNYAVAALSISGFLYFCTCLLCLVLAAIWGLVCPAIVEALLPNKRIDAVRGFFARTTAKFAN